ncbi:DUF6059 family protein [Streptacidiphilus sp. PAMC 29251]
MNGPEQFRRALRSLLAALGEGLMVFGGRDMYLASQQDDLPHWQYRTGIGMVFAPGCDGPPPGHPERLCPMMPLTGQERLLARELKHLDWASLKGRDWSGRAA